MAKKQTAEALSADPAELDTSQQDDPNSFELALSVEPVEPVEPPQQDDPNSFEYEDLDAATPSTAETPTAEATPSTSKDRTSTALFAARAELTALRNERIALAGVSTDPNGPEWEDLERRTAEVTRRVRRLEVIKEATEKHEDAATLADLQKKRHAAKDKANELARARILLAGKIDQVVATLGNLLQEWDVMGIECRKNAAFVHRKDTNQNWMYSAVSLAGGTDGVFAAGLHSALFTAGVGRKGIPVEYDITQRPGGNLLSTRDAAIFAADRLEAWMQRSIETLATPPAEG